MLTVQLGYESDCRTFSKSPGENVRVLYFLCVLCPGRCFQRNQYALSESESDEVLFATCPSKSLSVIRLLISAKNSQVNGKEAERSARIVLAEIIFKGIILIRKLKINSVFYHMCDRN